MTDRDASADDAAGDGGGRDPDPAVTVRRARPDDREGVVAFTDDTWADREGDDYIPRVFEEWVATDGPRQRTFVAEAVGAAETAAADGRPAEANGTVAGICQATLLSEHEAWVQGMRVHPDYRGLGLSTRLNDAAFAWARERGATVARNMVFSWNAAGLGGSRAAGFDPGTEFRWAHPAPDPAAGSDPAAGTGAIGTDSTAADVPAADAGAVDASTAEANAAWAFWTRSEARTALNGLALDAEESWALSELTRERLVRAADEGQLLTVSDDGTRAFTLRNRTYERERDEGEATTWAEYAVAAWTDPAACEALCRAVARDAAAVDADRTRVLVPERVRWVSDVAAARVPVSENPDFVMEADLTRDRFAPE